MRPSRILTTMICLVVCALSQAQTTFCHDERLRNQLIESGFLHSPLPVDTLDSYEANGWRKAVVSETRATASNSSAPKQFQKIVL